MIQNIAFLAALTLFLLAGWLASELSFLAPHKALLFRRHGIVIGGGALLVFLHLCALYYAVARWLFLRDTGRKLTHVDQQLATADAVHQDLREHLTSVRRS
jgi:hypothetical protein